MDIKAYIASGILEMYVMGQASEEESKEVEARIRKYPEVAKELESIQKAFIKFNSQNTKPIKNNLLNPIVEKINKWVLQKIKLNGHNLKGRN